MPAISVIVPVYKVEEYVKPCINSILAQSFTDFELILVDDGSPDQCGVICDSFAEKDSRIIVIHKENGGLSDARNKGIDIAKGEYLTFIDSDDLIHRDYLKTLYTLITDNNADISACRFENFFDDQSIYKDKGFTSGSDLFICDGKTACLSYYNMTGSIDIMAWGKLYRSSLFSDLRFPYGRINEDEGTVPLALYKAHKYVGTDRKLYFYRFRSDSIMNRPFTSKRFDGVACTQICIDYFTDNKEDHLVKKASDYRDIINSKLIIEAISKNAKKQIPKQYQSGELKALKILRTHLPYDKYSWYLAKIHPKWVLPHAYLRKIAKILNLRDSD